MELLGFTLDARTIAIIFIICAFVGGFVIISCTLLFSYYLLSFLLSPVFSYKEEVKKGRVIKLDTRPIYYTNSISGSTNALDGFSSPAYDSIVAIVGTEHLMLFRDESSGKESTFEITPEAFQELKKWEYFCQVECIILHLKKYIFGIRYFDHFCFENDAINA